jgi:hypothetical protein
MNESLPLWCAWAQVPVALRLLGVLGELVAGEVEGRGRGWAGGGSEEEEEEEEEGWEEEEADEQENVDANGGLGAAGLMALGGGLLVTGEGGVVSKGMVGGKAGGGRAAALQLPGGEEWGDMSEAAGTPGVGGGEELDPADVADPLRGVPLRQVVRQGLAGLASGGGKELLQAAVGQLAPREAAALQPLLP